MASYSYYSDQRKKLESQSAMLSQQASHADQISREKRLRMENRRRRRARDEAKKRVEEQERREREAKLRERREEKGLVYSPSSGSGDQASVGSAVLTSPPDDSQSFRYKVGNDSHLLGRLAEEYDDRVVETPSPEGLPYAHQSFMEEDSLCSEDSLDNQNATNDSTRDGCESLAMLREQLKNGGVLAKNPIYENLEGLDLSFTGDENSIVTKSTITTAASMAIPAHARPKGPSSDSYAKKHVKKLSPPPPVPSRVPPPSTNNSSASSNAPAPQWNKGFVSEEENRRRELRERQAAFAKQLKEQNRKKINHQKKVREQRILEHQRQQQQEQEQGSVRSAPVIRGQQHDLPLPPQYANSSDDVLLKTMKPGGKAAFNTGLTMDEESLKRSLARLDFRLEEKRVVLETHSLCSERNQHRVKKKNGKKKSPGPKAPVQQPVPCLPSYQPPQFQPPPPTEKERARPPLRSRTNRSNVGSSHPPNFEPPAKLVVDPPPARGGAVYIGPGIGALVTPKPAFE
mmetsp:Transcript_11887/g.24089  ORF Transcript_11887/g.24089 Transcript_11887/m.24089 type:complete len:515 (+) Transcript_11887:200-1744(+)